ncbi:MAG TPA: histone deacetylase [Trichormus sp. M33_DOE_039]|nr:histone deacetylase [Trichormus sp. M33_DOE_039]
MLPIIYSDEFLDHKTGRYHPEKPERLTAIVNALKEAVFAEKLAWRSPTPTSEKSSVMPLLLKAHSPAYIKKVQEIAANGGGHLDGDTPVSPRSYDVALLAVSAWLDGIDAVLNTANPAFVLSRPPGHHAEADAGMGFCLFSNAAIAAFYALEQPGIDRVAILDWDVHHGNGTQAIVELHPQIAYCSLHQYPCYPGTGRATERGFHDNVLNLPVPPGSDIGVYQPLLEKKVVPFLTKFQPDLLIVSAGYDANAEDPLASINLKPNDYASFTDACLGITRKILFGLEGGYEFDSLTQSVIATIERCLI